MVYGIREAEVTNQLEKMKTHKATGPDSDQLPIEIVKLLKERGTSWMTACMNNIITGGIPQEWRERV